MNSIHQSDTLNPVEEDSSPIRPWTRILQQLLELGENIDRSAVHSHDEDLRQSAKSKVEEL